MSFTSYSRLHICPVSALSGSSHALIVVCGSRSGPLQFGPFCSFSFPVFVVVSIFPLTRSMPLQARFYSSSTRPCSFLCFSVSSLFLRYHSHYGPCSHIALEISISTCRHRCTVGIIFNVRCDLLCLWNISALFSPRVHYSRNVLGSSILGCEYTANATCLTAGLAEGQ